ncbi:hypothetical protein HFO82_21920 [Rhizobium leguminosarum]|uniref:hypothetical protein n=1 Tax=Rhizobium leguminosarum TaxID=384 RepID=UPI001C98DFA6|nr:hypothetical protein [Rhizobium leguminosarum]MBY5501257.1 hypothetical protein [Rhizobium leguminosarum]
MHREISKTSDPKPAGDDDIALLKARVAELEDEIAHLEDEVDDLETTALDPSLLEDIRSDLQRGDLEYALVRIGRAIGWY